MNSLNISSIILLSFLSALLKRCLSVVLLRGDQGWKVGMKVWNGMVLRAALVWTWRLQ